MSKSHTPEIRSALPTHVPPNLRRNHATDTHAHTVSHHTRVITTSHHRRSRESERVRNAGALDRFRFSPDVAIARAPRATLRSIRRTTARERTHARPRHAYTPHARASTARRRATPRDVIRKRTCAHPNPHRAGSPLRRVAPRSNARCVAHRRAMTIIPVDSTPRARVRRTSARALKTSCGAQCRGAQDLASWGVGHMMATLTPFARAERRDKMHTARKNIDAQMRANAGASSIAHRGELGALF